LRWLWLCLLAGCQGDFAQPLPVAAVDEAYFRCRVQPILTKSCAAFACHGDGRRYYRVFARNRLRLGGEETTRNAPLGSDERQANFRAASVLLDPVAPTSPTESWLVGKPLEQAAGGLYHRGALVFNGGNVFGTRDDPDFATLVAFANGAKEDPACIEPGSDL